MVAGPPTSTSLRYVGPSRMSRPQVVIAGAGPGGLAAAMLLAHAGSDVVVLERKDRVGGRSATLRGGGFRFDLGPTFFLYPQILAEIFAACGHRLEDEVELLRLDPMYHLMFEAGGEIRASADLARLTADIAKLSPQDAAAVPRFIDDNRAKFEAFRPVLQRPFASWRDLLTPDLLRALPALRPLRSVDGDLARYFSDPRVRLAFSFQSKYLGMSPFNCPSLFTILSFLEYEYGVFHPARRLRRGDGGHGQGRAAGGRHDPARRADHRDPVRGPPGGRRADRSRRVPQRRARHQRRLRQDHDAASCPTACAAAGRIASWRRSASPARPS